MSKEIIILVSAVTVGLFVFALAWTIEDLRMRIKRLERRIRVLEQRWTGP